MKSEIFNKFLYFSSLISLICYIFISLLTSLSSFLSHSLSHSLTYSSLLPFSLHSFLPSSLSLYCSHSLSLSLSLHSLQIYLSFFQSVSLYFSVPLYLSLSLSASLSFSMFISFCSSPQQPFLTFLKKIPASYRELHSWNILCQSSVEVPIHALEPPK